MTPSPAPPATTPLFRAEAVEFQLTHRRWGELALLQPVALQTLSMVLVGAIGLILTFLCAAEYARKESVAGYLRPTAGMAKIYLPQAGTIRAVHVSEGDRVAENQALLTVETAQISGTGDDVNLALMRTLSEQRRSLSRQIEAEDRRTASERERLSALIRSLQTEVGLFDDQARLQAGRIKLARASLDAAAGLAAKGIIADIDYKRRQRELMELEQVQSSLGQQSVARAGQLTETRYALEQLPTARSERIQALRNDLAAAEQRLAEIEGRRAYVVRSPVAGRVSMLQAMSGEAADTHRLQATVMPAQGALLAELYIPTRAIGFVRPNQPVRLLYEAFPYQKFGTYGGRVASVSRTVVTAAETVSPVTLHEPAYRALVTLDRDTVDTEGGKVPLQPDMLLRADIVLEHRTIMAWLLDPLLGTRRVLDLDPVSAAFKARVVAPAASAFQSASAVVGPWLAAAAGTAAGLTHRLAGWAEAMVPGDQVSGPAQAPTRQPPRERPHE